MGVSVGCTQITAPISGGTTTQDITISGFGTVKAYILLATSATTNNSVTANLTYVFGASTGTAQLGVTGFSENNVDPSDIYSLMYDNAVLTFLDASGSLAGVAVHNSFITNGVRINWTSYPNQASLIGVVFFGGTDLSVVLGSISHTNNRTIPQTYTTGHQSDHIIFWSTFTTVNSLAANFIYSFGIANRSSPIIQGCNLVTTQDNQTTPASSSTVFNDRCIQSRAASGGALLPGAHLTSFDTTSFDLTALESDTNFLGQYLSLSYGGAVSFNAGHFASDTSTGNEAYTWPGFHPQAILTSLSARSVINSSVTSGNQAHATGFSAMTETAEWSSVVSDADGANPQNAKSLVNTNAMTVMAANNAVVASATGPSGSGSFDSTGYTLNYSVADSTARLFFALAIEESADTTVFDDIITEGQEFSDSVQALIDFGVSIADALKYADTFVDVYTANIMLPDGLTLSDLIIGQYILSILNTEGLSLSDVVGGSNSSLKSIVETLKIADSYILSASFFKDLAEGIKVSDVISALKIIQQEIQDGVILQDILESHVTFAPVLQEQLQFTDIMSAEFVIFLAIQEGLLLQDSTSGELFIARSIVESYIFSDIYLVGGTFSGVFEEGIRLSDAIGVLKTVSQEIQEGLELGDSAAIQTLFIKEIQEQYSFSDIEMAQVIFNTLQEEELVFQDEVSGAFSISPSVSEGFIFSDMFVLFSGFIDEFIEGIKYQDIFTAVFDMSVSVNEIALFSDTVEANFDTSVAVSDILHLSDNNVGQFLFNKLIEENIALSDAYIVAQIIQIQQIEGIIFEDIVFAIKTLSPINQEQLFFSDTFQTLQTSLRSLFDIFKISDTFSVLSILHVFTGEQFTLTDALLVSAIKNGLTTDLIYLQDSFFNTISMSFNILDSYKFADICSGLITFSKINNENASFSDSFINQGIFFPSIFDTFLLSDSFLVQVINNVFIDEILTLSDFKDVNEHLVMFLTFLVKTYAQYVFDVDTRKRYDFSTDMKLRYIYNLLIDKD